MNLSEIPTPALLVDRDVLEANLRTMASRAAELGVHLRPHVKTHKCVEIGQRQLAHGARGITVSTLHEAEAFAGHGFDDITWAYPFPLGRLAQARALSERITLGIVVDAEVTVTHLEQSGVPFRVWLKVDCGYHRAGVDPASEVAARLAEALAEASTLEFAGILSHSGHAYDRAAQAARARVAEEERSIMVEFAERLRDRGLDVPSISVGSTPAMTAAENLDGVTEARPGNYALFDYTQVALGSCQVTDCAATVLSTVISSQPGAGHAVIDAGALALSKDPGPEDEPRTMGRLLDDTGELDPDRYLVSLSQEHGVVNAALPVGSSVRVLPHHACLTTAQFDMCHVVSQGDVVDQWKIWRGRD